MTKPFVIDACALINASHSYNMSLETFSVIWKTLETMIDKGELISSSEIMDELKDNDIANWAKQHSECFIPLTQEIQNKTKEILKKYPSLI